MRLPYVSMTYEPFLTCCLFLQEVLNIMYFCVALVLEMPIFSRLVAGLPLYIYIYISAKFFETNLNKGDVIYCTIP